MRVPVLTLAVLLAGAAPAVAQSSSADWKFFGTVTLDGENQCFYDVGTIARGEDGNVRVWTECVLQTDLDAVDIKGKALNSASEKLAAGYVPPVGRATRLTGNQIVTITGYEQTVALSDIQPRVRILYEFDCNERRSRQVGDGTAADQKPSEWHQVLPTGNGATLLSLVCGAR